MRIQLSFGALAAFAASAAAQTPAAPSLAAVPVPAAQFDSAYYAWQAGNYPVALQGFEKMLTGLQPDHANVLLLLGLKPRVGTTTVLLNLAVLAAREPNRRVVVVNIGA